MTLSAAQIVLLVIALLFGWYVARVRTILFDRLILLSIFVIALVLIVYPEASTRLATLLGIGRGADLVFYLFILFVLFQFVRLAADRRAIQRDITEIVRITAIQNAQQGTTARERRNNEDPSGTEAMSQRRSVDQG